MAEGHCDGVGACRSTRFTHLICVSGPASVTSGILIASPVPDRRDQRGIAVDVDSVRGRPAPGETHGIYSLHLPPIRAERERCSLGVFDSQYRRDGALSGVEAL